MTTAIKVQGLSHVYPPNIVGLREVTLEIESADFLAVLGQNGSGKTTLVKHFNGILKPTQGKVYIEGVDTSGKSIAELSRKVGYVFQNPDHQICFETVRKEVAFGPHNLGLSDDEVASRVDEMTRLLGLEEVMDSPPAMLGLGERRKVTLASVLGMKPSILILDEPTTGIDRKGVIDIMQAVTDLNARGHTIILITHNMRVAAKYTRKALVLLNGEVLLHDTTKKLFASPETLEKTSLSPPRITQLAQKMQRMGIPKDVLTVEEFCEKIMPLMR